MARSSDRFARLVSTAAGLLLALLLGYTAAHFQWIPTGVLQVLTAPFAPPPTAPPGVLSNLRPRLELPQRHRFAGVRTNRPLPPGLADEPLASGITLLAGHFPETGFAPGIRAINRNGEAIHHWAADPKTIWPEGLPEGDVRKWQLNSQPVPCGMNLIGGDAVVALQGLGLARIGPKGTVRWRLDRMVRGPVARSSDGTLLVCGWNWRTDPIAVAKDYPGFAAPLAEDVILRVDPESGTVRGEISILPRIVARKDLQQQVYKFGGVTHNLVGLEDVQELTADQAGAFPGLAAGDLLVTLRTMGVLAVLDPKDGNIKWWHNAPIVSPSGACFLPSGEVAAFDTNSDSSPLGQVLGGSRIYGVRPDVAATRSLGGDQGVNHRNVLPPLGDRKLGIPVPSELTRKRNWFFTNTGGSLQRLPGGRWLITETEAGRAAEFRDDGGLVWEYAVAAAPPAALTAPADGPRIFPLQRAVRLPMTWAELMPLVR